MCGFTLPHLRVDVERGTATEIDNPLRTPEEVFKLCDESWVFERFRDDPVLAVMLSMDRRGRPEAHSPETVAVSFGLPPGLVANDTDATGHLRLHTAAALFSTIRVLEMTEELLAGLGKKLLVMLSFGAHHIRDAIEGSEPFDRQLLDFLATRSYPVLDMRGAFATEYARSAMGPDAFLHRYYNGHHTPWGNFFTASALSDVVEPWLDSSRSLDAGDVRR